MKCSWTNTKSTPLSLKIATMGTFIGHLVPGLALTFLGLWHLINTVRAYCIKGSSKFTARFWYPLNCHVFVLKYLQLIFVFSFSLLAIFMQVLDLPLLHLAFRLDGLEHAAMFLHLAIFAGFTLAAEVTNSSGIFSEVSGILATSVFSQELFLLHFHSADHVGLEGHYHWLLQLIVIASLVAAIAATWNPTSFSAALILPISVIFQGCWFVNMGFFLWTPEFVPKGCFTHLDEGGSSHGAVMCESAEADLRARALANLQFSWILAGILMFTGFISLNSAVSRKQSTEYEQLQIRSTDVQVPINVDSFKITDP